MLAGLLSCLASHYHKPSAEATAKLVSCLKDDGKERLGASSAQLPASGATSTSTGECIALSTLAFGDRCGPGCERFRVSSPAYLSPCILRTTSFLTT
jgi:hypothetical protein